jgi:ADP-heptose:LPS heptosyltransferase
VSALWGFGKQLRREQFPVALDTQGLLVSGLVTFLSGAPRRIGLDANREGNTLFLTEPVVPSKPRVHVVEKLLGFCDVLNIPRLAVRPQTYLINGECAAAEQLLGNTGGTPIIGCIIGASTAAKTYPVEQWIAVIRLLSEAGFQTLLLGGPGENATAEQILQETGNQGILDLTGKTPIRVLASVLAKCQVVIGGDSGPTHLAVAVGTPVVGLYGVTDPARTGPHWGVAPSITLDFAEKEAPPETRRPRHPTLPDAIARIPAESVTRAVASLIS